MLEFANSLSAFAKRIIPGLLLTIAVALAAQAIQQIEVMLSGRAWIEGIVLSILLGTIVRTAWPAIKKFNEGLQFSAKTLLEAAIVLLGASISAEALAAAGVNLVLGIAFVVVTAIVASYGIGRAIGLTHNLATLVACGNGICGNSAIAAAAPVIGADSRDVAASIAFTAVFSVLVVLMLPLISSSLHLSMTQFGVLAGLTVYAVPQVVAATLPVGLLSAQVGAMVKLVRVAMLGPVILVLALSHRRDQRVKLRI